MLFVRVRRIELPTTAWKAVVLPLNYTRNTRSIAPVSILHSCADSTGNYLKSNAFDFK